MSFPNRVELADALMTDFARRTGLTSSRRSVRYLWTDAFAVQNFLGLGHLLGEPREDALAMRVVGAVHDVLGRPRPDSGHAGWLGAADEATWRAHPTRGGLRIGKPLPERAPEEPLEPALEWDRDGQYLHYLTRWMRALDQAARWLERPHLNVWARELAASAHAAFAHGGRGARRLYWKMSIDLKRPLVASMGKHDALDALVTYSQLEASARDLRAPAAPSLAEPIADVASMIEPDALWTDDALGLGSLLLDAQRAMDLARAGAFVRPGLIAMMLATGLDGLRVYASRGELRAPADRRLAFRELGLALGLRAIAHEESSGDADGLPPGVRPLVDALARHASLAVAIESFWSDPSHQAVGTWTDHRDINEVMLASSLVPEGCILLDRPAPIAARAQPPRVRSENGAQTGGGRPGA